MRSLSAYTSLRPPRYRVFFRGVELTQPATWEQDIAWAPTEWKDGLLTTLEPIPGIEPDATQQSPGQPMVYMYHGPIDVKETPDALDAVEAGPNV